MVLLEYFYTVKNEIESSLSGRRTVVLSKSPFFLPDMARCHGAFQVSLFKAELAGLSANRDVDIFSVWTLLLQSKPQANTTSLFV